MGLVPKWLGPISKKYLNRFTHVEIAHFKMGAQNAKLRAMHLPVQSGKTFKITEIINHIRECNSLTGDDQNDFMPFLNIVITSNNRILVNQTAKRLERDIISIGDNNQAVAWTSSDNVLDNLEVNDMFRLILDEKVHTIVCCTNTIRLSKVDDLIRALNQNRLWRGLISIWVDEADACIRMLCKEKFTALGALRKVHRITFVSATMDAIYKRFKNIPIYTFPGTHPDIYFRYKDCDVSIIDTPYEKSKEEDYVRAVLNKHPECVTPGSRWIIPGNMVKRSHDAVARVLFERGFNVMILNSDHKEIRFCNSSRIIDLMDIGHNQELGKVICRLYWMYPELRRAPFAVTGHLCLGRGITFNDRLDGNEFLLNYAILPSLKSKADAYQFIGRALGNIRNFRTFQVPRIFTLSGMDAKIRDQENLAIHLAINLYNKGVDVPTTDDIRFARADLDDFAHRTFSTQDDAIAFAKATLKIKFNRRKADQYPKEILKRNRGEIATAEALIARQWGLNAHSPARMLPIPDNKWIVFWRPSFFRKE